MHCTDKSRTIFHQNRLSNKYVLLKKVEEKRKIIVMDKDIRKVQGL